VKHKFNKGQLVYSKHQKCEKIYIVYKGEFEAVLKEDIEQAKSFPYSAYTGPLDQRE